MATPSASTTRASARGGPDEPSNSDRLLVFAYGSNMSTPRIRDRAPSARALCAARLSGFALVFEKRGRDGSAKASVTERAEREVWGVVFEVTRDEKVLLDGFENLGNGYDEVEVVVENETGERLSVLAYVAGLEHVDGSLTPYDWYLEHLLNGAQEHRLPDPYVQDLQSHPTRPDPDGERARRERGISRG